MRWKRRDWEADREGGRSRKRTGGKWAGMEKGSGENEGREVESDKRGSCRKELWMFVRMLPL